MVIGIGRRARACQTAHPGRGLTAAEYAGELVADRVEGVFDRGRGRAQYVALAARGSALRSRRCDLLFLGLLFLVRRTLLG